MIGDDSDWIGGAYVHCSYFLTGENRIYERYGQHGANSAANAVLELLLGARLLRARRLGTEGALVEPDAQRRRPGEYNDLTLGFNWYWTDRIRIMFD